jgi:hypothetical protein
MTAEKDCSLDTLLDLDGEIFPMDNGCWAKFEIKPIPPSKTAPHGIKYSLTLHDRNNNRVIGFDNAHAVKPRKQKGFSGRKVTWDHTHRLDRVNQYNFQSAGQLLEDFWKAVDQYLKG